MARVEEFIKRYQLRNSKDRLGDFDDDEWLQLEVEFMELWKTASDEEKKLLNKRIALESFSMVCSGIRWEREQKKVKSNG